MTIILNKSNNNDPQHQTRLSAGFDIASNEDYILQPGEIKAISTGLFFNQNYFLIKQEKSTPSIPNKFRQLPFLMIVSRSSLALKGIVVNNAPGIVDLDYPDEIKVILRNQTNEPFEIKTGMRIAQGIFVDCFQMLSVKEEERKGGFGSTNS
ncbi:MAG: dUTP diphosphatase [Candidatus Dojkabacteria bacterium]|nr:dUTP diphosphatase [Candidatus Dojkabacteria bacterium]